MPVLPKSWKQQAPINFWRTWLNDHVTTHGLSEGSPPVLSRLQWKTTAAATVFPPQLYTTSLFSLLVCACLFVSAYSTDPSPFSAFQSFLLDGNIERRGKK